MMPRWRRATWVFIAWNVGLALILLWMASWGCYRCADFGYLFWPVAAALVVIWPIGAIVIGIRWWSGRGTGAGDAESSGGDRKGA